MGKKTQEAKKAAMVRQTVFSQLPRRAGRRVVTQNEVARLARKPHRCGWPS